MDNLVKYIVEVSNKHGIYDVEIWARSEAEAVNLVQMRYNGPPLYGIRCRGKVA